MNRIKTLICFLAGHTQSNICHRCGRAVWLAGKPRSTFQERVNALYSKKKDKYIGSIRLIVGLKLYSLNLSTGEVSKVAYNESDGSKKAAYEPECLYFNALNQKNADRKADKILKAVKA